MNVEGDTGEAGIKCLRHTNIKLNPRVQGVDGRRIVTGENESSWESPLKLIFDMRN